MAPVKRDVVLSCYATVTDETLGAIKQGPKAKGFFQPSDGFKDPPLVVSVPYRMKAEEKNVSPAYARQAAEYKQKYGSIIKGALSELAPGVSARTVSLSCFSGGQAFAKEVIAAGEGKYVDSILMLDGLHLSAANKGKKTDGIEEEWKPWVEYAKQAWLGERLLVLLHTNIIIPSQYVLSTTESANLISDQLDKLSMNVPPGSGTFKLSDITEAAAASEPPPLVEIWSPIATPSTKKWEKFPWKLAQNAGNYLDIDIGGNTAQDHIFAATYGQRMLWKNFYRTRMGQEVNLCFPMSGLGADGGTTACRRNLLVLPEEAQGGARVEGPSSESGSGAAKAFWFLAGLGAAYGIGSLLRK